MASEAIIVYARGRPCDTGPGQPCRRVRLVQTYCFPLSSELRYIVTWRAASTVLFEPGRGRRSWGPWGQEGEQIDEEVGVLDLSV